MRFAGVTMEQRPALAERTLLAWFRDPFSGLSHLAGALVGGAGLLYLVSRPGLSDTTVAAVSIYGVSLVLLYLSSAAYHLLRVSPSRRARLRQLDHSMVPVFIAGTYTPLCVLGLHAPIGPAVLATIWALAVLGLLKGLYWIHSPRWVTAGVFVLMGWVIVLVAYPLYQAVPGSVFYLIFGGGGFYSLGAAIYAKKWPDPFPPHFGFHEIWHLFVLGGSACHFAAILLLI
jgi:hemolysin III